VGLAVERDFYRGIIRSGKGAKESTGEKWKEAGNKKQGTVR